LIADVGARGVLKAQNLVTMNESRVAAAWSGDWWGRARRENLVMNFGTGMRRWMHDLIFNFVMLGLNDEGRGMKGELTT
jgi:hypothetical protein